VATVTRLDRRPLPVALQPIGCEHPITLNVSTLSEPDTYRCVNPNCSAVWQETEWRRQVWPRVDIQPDPRISTQRPGWLADDQQWRDQLQAMDRDDCRWIERHWDMAGGAEPAVDTSWVRTGTIGGGALGWRHLVGAVVLLFLVVGGPLLAMLAAR
jgi:hypothetical protein